MSIAVFHLPLSMIDWDFVFDVCHAFVCFACALPPCLLVFFGRPPSWILGRPWRRPLPLNFFFSFFLLSFFLWFPKSASPFFLVFRLEIGSITLTLTLQLFPVQYTATDTGSDTGSIFCLTCPFSLPIPGFPSASFRFYAVFPMGIFHSPFVIFSIDILLETNFSDLFLFLGHPILGFPNASFGFYAVLPIGILWIRYRFYILFNLAPLSLRFLGSPAHPSGFMQCFQWVFFTARLLYFL